MTQLGGAKSMVESETRFTVDWWQRRSIGELRELSKAGLSGGGLSEAAALELERRAREARQHQQQLADEATNHEKKRRIHRFAIACSVVGVILVLLVVVGFMTSSGRPAATQPTQQRAPLAAHTVGD